MLRRDQRISRHEIVWFQEHTTDFGPEKYHKSKNQQKNGYAEDILHGVIRVEWNSVQRYTLVVLQLLDFNTVRIIGTRLMQRSQVQHHQHQ